MGNVPTTNRIARLMASSIGGKLLMAVTGVLLLGFVVTHLLGNLLLLQGQDALNAYAAWLKSLPVLWVARAGLLAIFVAHIGQAIRLTFANQAARPTPYAHPRASKNSTFASRSMIYTGLAIVAFVIYHLLHFTLGLIQPDAYDAVDALGRHDVYGMVVAGFSHPAIAISYVVAMLLLGVHLLHGVQSVFQTLGANPSAYKVAIQRGAILLPGAIVLGNCSLPILVWLGAIRPEGIL